MCFWKAEFKETSKGNHIIPKGCFPFSFSADSFAIEQSQIYFPDFPGLFNPLLLYRDLKLYQILYGISVPKLVSHHFSGISLSSKSVGSFWSPLSSQTVRTFPNSKRWQSSERERHTELRWGQGQRIYFSCESLEHISWRSNVCSFWRLVGTFIC